MSPPSVGYEGTTNGEAANRQLRLRGRRAAARGRLLVGRHSLRALHDRNDCGRRSRRGEV